MYHFLHHVIHYHIVKYYTLLYHTIQHAYDNAKFT